MGENTLSTVRSIGDLIRRAIKIKTQLDAVKPLYEELDKLTLEIASDYNGGEPIPMEDGVVVLVVDNFASTNTVFRPLGIKRFELKIMTAEEFAYSKMSKSEKAAYTKAKNKTEQQS